MKTARWLPLVLGFQLAASLYASPVTLEQLKRDTRLTPERFARYFGNFDYVYHPEVQSAEAFLRSRAGDCDDYAILADQILSLKGYKTRLIYIVLDNSVTHTVCYVAEEKGYLDYNNRMCLFGIEHSDPGIREIADKIARTFRQDWAITAEFTYANGRQQFIRTVNKPRSGKRDRQEFEHR